MFIVLLSFFMHVDCVSLILYLLCFADNKKILELDPSNYDARRSIIRLEPLAREKTEKMKEEMIGTLTLCLLILAMYTYAHHIHEAYFLQNFMCMLV